MSEERIYVVNWEKKFYFLIHYVDAEEFPIKYAIEQLKDVFNSKKLNNKIFLFFILY